MSIRPEEKKRYFLETAIVLRREGFRIEPSVGGRLGVWLDDHPICEVDQIGGITHRSDNIPAPEYVAAKDKAYRIVCTTAEYMRQMEQAPPLKASGLEDSFKVLADFNGTVLAGTHSKYGVQFVTWDWDYDRKGVCFGHYFNGSYDSAKQDFATRSDLIPEQRLFKDEQLIEIYRCCVDTLDAGFDPTEFVWDCFCSDMGPQLQRHLQKHFNHHSVSFFLGDTHWKRWKHWRDRYSECPTATRRHCFSSRPMRTSGAESSGSLTAAALPSSQSGSPASSRSCPQQCGGESKGKTKQETAHV